MVHFLLALAVFLAILGYKNKYVQSSAFVVLFAFAALRYMYGNDYKNYFLWFKHIHNGGVSQFRTEVLYNALNLFLPSFPVLIALTSLLLVWVVYRLISKNLPTHYAWIGVFIFVVNPTLFLMNLSAIRQSIAACFFILAVDFACRKKYFWYLALVVVATLFHKSAILLLPLCIIINAKPVKPWFCWAIIGVTLVLLLSSQLLLDAVVWVATQFGDKNYIYWANQDMKNSLRATLLTSVFFFYTLYNLPKLKGRGLIFAKLYLISPWLGVLAKEASMLTRLQIYFEIFSVVALPIIFMQVQSRGNVVVNRRNVLITYGDCLNKYVMPALIVVIYLLRYYSFFTNDLWEPFFTYRSIFSLL